MKRTVNTREACERGLGTWGQFNPFDQQGSDQCHLMVRERLNQLISGIEEIEKLSDVDQQVQRLEQVRQVFQEHGLLLDLEKKEEVPQKIPKTPALRKKWVNQMIGQLALSLAPYLLEGTPEGVRLSPEAQKRVIDDTEGRGTFTEKLEELLVTNREDLKRDVEKGVTTSWWRRIFGAGNPSLPRCHRNFNETLCARQKPWCQWSFEDRECHLNYQSPEGLSPLIDLGTRKPWQIEVEEQKKLQTREQEEKASQQAWQKGESGLVWRLGELGYRNLRDGLIDLWERPNEEEEDRPARRLLVELWDEGLAPWLGFREIDLERHLRTDLTVREQLFLNLALALVMLQLREESQLDRQALFSLKTSSQPVRVFRAIDKIFDPRVSENDRQLALHLIDNLRLELSTLPLSWGLGPQSQGDARQKIPKDQLEKLVRRFRQESLTLNSPWREDESEEEFMSRRRISVPCRQQLEREGCEQGNCHWTQAGWWKRWLGVGGEASGSCELDLQTPSSRGQIRRGIEASVLAKDSRSLDTLRQEMISSKFKPNILDLRLPQGDTLASVLTTLDQASRDVFETSHQQSILSLWRQFGAAGWLPWLSKEDLTTSVVRSRRDAARLSEKYLWNMAFALHLLWSDDLTKNKSRQQLDQMGVQISELRSFYPDFISFQEMLDHIDQMTSVTPAKKEEDEKPLPRKNRRARAT